jgi:hypothetical protein
MSARVVLLWLVVTTPGLVQCRLGLLLVVVMVVVVWG